MTEEKTYLIVGESLFLKGVMKVYDLELLEMHVHKEHSETLGILRINSSANGLNLILENSKLTVKLELEALRLFARIVTRLSDFKQKIYINNNSFSDKHIDLLKRDGFIKEPDKGYSRLGGKFVRQNDEKADNMSALYEDPYTIPWNFVPIETDLLKFLIEHSNLLAENKTLELGCGYGKNSYFLQNHGFDLWGIDISEKAIERCKVIVEKPNQFEASGADKLSHTDNFFDYVIDVGCLHCMNIVDRQLAVKEIERVLKPGGYLFSRIFKPRPQKWLSEQPFKTSVFGINPKDFTKLFSEAGLDYQITEETNHANYIKAQKRYE